MFRASHFANAVSHTIDIRRHGGRSINFMKVKEKVKHIIGMDPPKAPYEHVCQVGDPVLRGRAMKIEPEVIKVRDFQKAIDHLINVMRKYDACGMSAPQIGLPWQMFVIEHTKEHLELNEKYMQKIHEMKIIPATVFINPEIKVIDHTPIMFYEGCESVRGFSASVPRALEVEVTALNALAEQFTWRARGWSARIAQHEYDHLQGQLYIDKMDMNTFHCTAWAKINENGGNIRLSYLPK